MKNLTSNVKKAHTAFVTFTKTVADDVVDQYKISTFKFLFTSMGYKMRGKRVIVDFADEPEDVKWENLGYTFCQRLGRICLNGFITLVILAACCVANVFVSKASKDNSEDKDISTVIMILFSVLFSLITLVINTILGFVIPYITNFAKHSNQTNYYCSVTIKLALSLFLNSSIIPVITYDREIYFDKGGLLMTVFTNWLFLCFLTPMMELVDVSYILFLIQWKLARNKGFKSTLTQRQANEEAGPYEMDIVTRFSQIANIMFYTAFYILIFPPGILITILGLLFQYWVCKLLISSKKFQTVGEKKYL